VTENSKYRVLVVDDDPSVLTTYRLILEQQGYDVVASSTCLEAITAVKTQKFDALLCDYSLEEQHTGFEVITAAREYDPKLPAALVTGYATQETAEQAAAQDIGIMYKPIEIEEFLTTTSNLLRRNDESNQENVKENAGAQASGKTGEHGGGSGARRRSPTSSRKAG
jgi:DNA-binding NtrC family response regulator